MFNDGKIVDFLNRLMMKKIEKELFAVHIYDLMRWKIKFNIKLDKKMNFIIKLQKDQIKKIYKKKKDWNGLIVIPF